MIYPRPCPFGCGDFVDLYQHVKLMHGNGKKNKKSPNSDYKAEKRAMLCPIKSIPLPEKIKGRMEK